MKGLNPVDNRGKHGEMVKSNFGSMDSEQMKFHFMANFVVLCFENDQLQTLLRPKVSAHGSDEWQLLGDLVRSNEELCDTQCRVMENFLGLKSFHSEQMQTHGPIEYDQFGLAVTTTFLTVILEHQVDLKKMYDYGIDRFGISALPKLGQNEKRLIDLGVELLRGSMRTSPVAFKLLPDKFTFPQLRHLFEVILESDFDKRNFRNKFNSKGYLVRLEEKDRFSSRKGAYKYRFNLEKYERTREFNI